MNPFSSWSSVSWESFRLGYDFLTWYDADYRPAPDLATSWETSEDGLTWTFHIREGMEWQDGVPLTARDIAFTYDLILETRQPAYIQYLTGVTDVTATDDATLVITTAATQLRDAGALRSRSCRSTSGRRSTPTTSAEYENLPFVGSGPFRVVSLGEGRVACGSRPTLRTRRSWAARPSSAPSPSSPAKTRTPSPRSTGPAPGRRGRLPGDLRAALRRDARHDAPWRRRRSASTSSASTAGRARAARATRCCATRPSGAPSTGPSTSARSSATAMAGLAEPGHVAALAGAGGLALGGAGGRAVPLRPRRAKQILEDAGYADRDGDGVREDVDGDKLSFRLVALDEYPEDQVAARMIVGWCRDVGIQPPARAHGRAGLQ